MIKKILDDMERVLDTGTDLRLEVLGTLSHLLERASRHRLELAPLHGDVRLHGPIFRVPRASPRRCNLHSARAREVFDIFPYA